MAINKSPEFKSSSSFEDEPSTSSSSSSGGGGGKGGGGGGKSGSGMAGGGRKAVLLSGVATKRKVYYLDHTKKAAELSDGSSEVSQGKFKDFSSGDFLSTSDGSKETPQNSEVSLGDLIVQKSSEDQVREEPQQQPLIPPPRKHKQLPQLQTSQTSLTPSQKHQSSPHKTLKMSFSASSLQERDSPNDYFYDSFNITSQSLDAGINEELDAIRNPFCFASLRHANEVQDINKHAYLLENSLHLNIPHLSLGFVCLLFGWTIYFGELVFRYLVFGEYFRENIFVRNSFFDIVFWG